KRDDIQDREEGHELDGARAPTGENRRQDDHQNRAKYAGTLQDKAVCQGDPDRNVDCRGNREARGQPDHRGCDPLEPALVARRDEWPPPPRDKTLSGPKQLSSRCTSDKESDRYDVADG